MQKDIWKISVTEKLCFEGSARTSGYQMYLENCIQEIYDTIKFCQVQQKLEAELFAYVDFADAKHFR